MKKVNKNYLTVIDIGTTKICTLIAEIKKNENDEIIFEIKGIGFKPTEGLDKGVVNEINKATKSISESIIEAEEMAQITAQNIYIGIAGAHIRSCNVNSSIRLQENHQPREIEQKDINAVIDAARNIVKNQGGFSNLKIIHAIPHYFNCDENKGIRNPLKMQASLLEARVHVVMANPLNIDNILKCLEMAGYKVDYDHVILEPIASAYAVLNKDQRDLGAIVIDIGGGTTDIAIFYRDSIRYSAVFPYGGDELSRNLSKFLRISYNQAEDIKLSQGQATTTDIEDDEQIEASAITGKGATYISKRSLALQIQEEMANLFNFIFSEISKNINMKFLKAGIYLTGGASQLNYLDTLINKISRMPAIKSNPHLTRFKGQISSLEKPQFSTALGIFLYLHESWIKKGLQQQAFPHKKIGFGKKVGNFVKSWFV